MILLKQNKKQSKSMQVELMINNTVNIAEYKTVSKTENLCKIREFVFDNSIKFGFDTLKAEELVLAVDEACTNLIKHAFKDCQSETITVKLKSDSDKFIVSIIDTSSPFDPREAKDPDFQKYKEECKRGGLGIFIMKSLVDTIDYEISQNGNCKNILTLTKQLS